MNPIRTTILFVVLAASLVFGPVVRAQEEAASGGLDARAQAALVDALDDLNLSVGDLRFTRDVAEPWQVPAPIRELLREPLEGPRLAERLYRHADENAPARLAADLRETLGWPVPPAIEPRSDFSLDERADVPSNLVAALNRFYRSAERAAERVKRAFRDLPRVDREALAAGLLADTYNLEDHAEIRQIIEQVGIEPRTVTHTLNEARAIDPEPGARRFSERLRRIDLAELFQAGWVLRTALDRLAREASSVERWPARPLSLRTPLGEIFIGSTNEDTYTERALLILDPGGDDTYSGVAASADGLLQAPLAALADLGGKDMYRSREFLGAGAALFGAAAVLDVAGNDRYDAAFAGQGAGLFGSAWFEDRGGDDDYEAYALAQGAGYVGTGFLLDSTGNDTYTAGAFAQAFAGVFGGGLLLDREGNDRYYAGGRIPDYERHPDRYLSLAQGCAMGGRPFFGGGLAALIDLSGNDSYLADVYGQGVGYWYAAGLLLDGAGQDTYAVYHYGQGTGIHLSLGLLWDRAGSDDYLGHVLCQGSAHDYAVGMLFDDEGDDTYTGAEHAQGRAINNALALLLDAGGNDAYYAREPEQCQGIGNDGDQREYGSLALLLDLAGKDRYTCGVRDGEKRERPNFGIVYDEETRQ